MNQKGCQEINCNIKGAAGLSDKYRLALDNIVYFSHVWTMGGWRDLTHKKTLNHQITIYK